MPNINKELAKCKHPNSRKTLALVKKSKKETVKQEAKMGQMIKQNIVGEKIKWFQDNLSEDKSVYSKKDILEMITRYISRFDDELSQIDLKHSIGGRKNRQHASRQDVITMTKKRELEEHESCGLEIPDLTIAQHVALLKTWNGELRFLQNFKLRRFPKKSLLT